MPRFCAEILATGSQCTQFARKGQSPELSLWCRAHADPRLRERNADTRQYVAWVAGMDLFTIAGTLGNIAYELRTKLIQPLHAEAILDAVLARLDRLNAGEQATAPMQFGSSAPPQPGFDKSHSSNGLQVVPLK